MKKIILKEYSTVAKFIKDCFLSFKSFEPKEIIRNLPIIEKIEELINDTKLSKKLTNVIDSNHPDSAEYQVIILRKLAFLHMEDFSKEAKEDHW